MRLTTLFSILALSAPALIQAQPVEVDLGKCAPGVDRETITVLAQELSGGEVYALTPFGGETLPYANPADAVAALQNKDNTPKDGWLVGLMQINSKTLAKEGVKLEDALDPCTNLRIAAKELKLCFQTKEVEQTEDKLKPLLRCFLSTRVPEKAMPDRIQSVIDRVKPTVPALSTLMQPKPEAPLVYSVQNPEHPLIF